MRIVGRIAIAASTLVAVCVSSAGTAADSRAQQPSSAQEAAKKPDEPVDWPKCALSPLNTPELYEKFRRSVGADDHVLGAPGSVPWSSAELGFTKLVDYEVKIDEVLKGDWKPGRIITAEHPLVGRVELADGMWGETTIFGYKPLLPGSRYLLFLSDPHYPWRKEPTRLFDRAQPGGVWHPTLHGISAYELRADGTVDPACSYTSKGHLATAYRGVPIDKLLTDVRAAVMAK